MNLKHNLLIFGNSFGITAVDAKKSGSKQQLAISAQGSSVHVLLEL
jgi:hypothetical protein